MGLEAYSGEGMIRKKKVWVPGLVAVAALVSWALVARGNPAGSSYRFVVVERGDVESVVTSTGTLQATETVDVGTQVSGQIAELHVDFNDRVQEGQLLALIDPVILEQEVRSSEASLARSEAELKQAERELDRANELNRQQVVTDAERDQAQYAYDVAKASYAQAEINLERERRNLEYTVIRSPISGVVVARSVDVGQTVAASLSAPTLFVIAQDLAQMEILASVDESDIGQIREGQEVRFTVQAYPDRTFTGTVRQVRLESQTQENVVSYGTVISVSNEDGKLLPGMTATVDFIVESAQDVLLVPNTALRFRATEKMWQAVMEPREPGGAAGSPVQLTGGPQLGGAPADMPQEVDGPAPPAPDTLWYLDGAGRLAVAPVRTGMSDGQNTVLLRAPDVVTEGLQVIAAVTTGSSQTTSANPFQSSNEDRRGPPPPGAF